jgi:hypothetical protein
MGVTMNFDIGEVLSRAWQITWKHKVLWVINLLPFLISFLFFPIWLILVFQRNFDLDRISNWMQNPVYVGLIVIVYLLFFIVSIFLQVASRSSVTLGIYRAETGIQPVAFMDLVKNGFLYFWRFLGISFLVGAGFLVVFVTLFALMGVLSVVTMGIAALCFQPLFLLMIPFIWLVMAFMEQSESAIIADKMNVMDSLKQAYELIKSNFWKYVLITLVLYVGMGALTSLLVFPFMIPMFFFMMRNLDSGMDFNSIMRMQAIFGLVIFPLIAVVQGFSLTYMKSTMMLVYLRLTRSVQPRLVLLEAIS